MRQFKLPATLAVLGLALAPVALAPVALAPAAAAEPAGVQLAQAESYSEEKLQSFALAALEIQQIRSDFVERAQQAETDEQRQQLAEEANVEMVGAVESTPGITVDEYNSIIEASAEDEGLAERINQQMQSAAQ